jgi:hypothetical protein
MFKGLTSFKVQSTAEPLRAVNRQSNAQAKFPAMDTLFGRFVLSVRWKIRRVGVVQQLTTKLSQHVGESQYVESGGLLTPHFNLTVQSVQTVQVVKNECFRI